MEDLDAADRTETKAADEARRLYESVAARARAEGSAALEARALAGLGRLARRAGSYPEAGAHLLRALSLAESAGDTALASRAAASLADLSLEAGRQTEARSWYEKALQAADTARDLRQRASVLTNLAMLETIQVDEAIRFGEQAAESARLLSDLRLEAGALQAIGDRLSMAADYASAVEKLSAAAALYEKAGDRSDLADVLTSMGRLQRLQGRPADAIPLYERSLRLLEPGDARSIVQNLNATAIAHASLDDYRRALSLYEEAYRRAVESKSSVLIDFMRANLAGHLIVMGDNARAVPLLEDVLKRGVERNPGIRHNQLSQAYLGLARTADALEHSNRAVELSAALPYQAFKARLQRAAVRQRLGDLEGALADAHEATVIIESMRAKLVPLDVMKQGFSESYQNVYSRLVSLYQQHGEPMKALQLMEFARSRAFLDLLATRDIHMRSSVDAAVSRLRDNEGRLLSTATAQPASVDDLRDLARRFRSTVVTYWVSWENTVLIGVVSADGAVHLERVNADKRRLTELVELAAGDQAPGNAVNGAAVRGNTGRVAASNRTGAACRGLYKLLIEPVQKFLPPTGSRLTIISHGPLMRLSFAALQSASGRYLVEDYSLHYLPAAPAVARQGEEEQAAASSFLFVADPQLPPSAKGETRLPPLFGAREEVRALARLVRAERRTTLVGPQAGKARVIDAMRGASVVHFATHGVTRDDEPLDSYLALGASGQTADDGRLKAEDVYGLNVEANLVVLGSCRSARGRSTGEGHAALTRAFFYAGARSIVASVSDIPDQPASRLLQAFYRAWLGGQSKVDALRTAQLRLLRDLRAGRVKMRTAAGDFVLPEHPSLWAGFMLLGQP